MPFPIFISSSDSYSDLWPIFFELFKRMWPEFDGKIYLQTEEKTFSYKGLNIICTNVGKLNGFGKTLLAGLNKVKEDNILFFMIDYILMDKVNHKKVLEYYKYFESENLDSLIMCHNGWINSKSAQHPDFISFLPPSKKRLFGYQIAFWKKTVLESIVLPWENPWLSEWFGDARCEKNKVRFECLRKGLTKAIPYDSRGCLHQGRWLDNAILFLNEQKIMVDYSIRGLYSDKEVYNTLGFKLRHRLQKIKCGLRGSYIDLLYRKPIH